MQNEDDAISALSGFGLDQILTGLSLPGGSGLSSQLGLYGGGNLNAGQIYNDKWDEEAVGTGQGEDWEDEVDREIGQEEDFREETPVFQPTGPKEKKKRIRIVKHLVERPKTVHERFPAFQKDAVLNFSELFKGYTVKKSRLAKRPFQLENVYSGKPRPPRGFLEAVVGDTKRQVETRRVEEVVSSGNIEHDLREAIQAREKTDSAINMPLHDRAFDLVLLSNWEEQIIYEPEPQSAQSHRPVPETNLTTPANTALESGAWTQSIIWSPRAPFRDFTQLELNHEEDIIPEERVAENTRPRKRLRADLKQVQDKFNLSNDNFYEVSKDGAKHRVRQTFGQLTVEHAYPAQKLQLPFYKTRLTKAEARSWHRPALQFPSNVELRFSKVRTAKKMKDKSGRKLGKGGNFGEGLRTTGDLSLRDTSNFVLWEYSEEHPPMVSNFGMGSVLVNYYRKKDDKDDHIPKFDLGTPFLLEPQDDSPFMKFGSVNPGQSVPALYNNLVRAPLFRHKAQPTDFLIIKSTVKGDTKYFLREIKTLFVVGQTYPVQEVPGPHSRKITNTIKHRLQIIAFKLLAKNHEERLKINRLMKYFPDQNELQMRQRLKEFMEYHRTGKHQGYWRLKSNWTIPSDTDMLKMVAPEQVVLTESMQVGQRHLQDAGYSQAADGADGDESTLSVEQQLAPWITTKNFLLATQAKAMLRLHGDGDPSGRGEAFSFIRISMKDIFVKAGEDYDTKMAEVESRAKSKSAHRYNVAEQQVIYKSEIERVWKAQFDSLSKKEPPLLTAEDERRDSIARKPPPERLQRQSSVALPGPSSAMSPGGPSSQAGGSMSRASSLERDRTRDERGDDNRRVLRIKRLVDGEWETEIIRDPAVIRAYLRGKQALEEEETLTDILAPTGDAEKDKRARKRLEEEIAKKKKNQERRLHRKNAKLSKEGGTLLHVNRPVKPETTRRCGHCGQMGHMKTNRNCPRWAEFNSGAVPIAATGANAPMAGGVSAPVGGFNRGLGFANPVTVPSPLAMSPPYSAAQQQEGSGQPIASGSGSTPAPKIKLKLGAPRPAAPGPSGP